MPFVPRSALRPCSGRPEHGRGAAFRIPSSALPFPPPPPRRPHLAAALACPEYCRRARRSPFTPPRAPLTPADEPPSHRGEFHPPWRAAVHSAFRVPRCLSPFPPRVRRKSLRRHGLWRGPSKDAKKSAGAFDKRPNACYTTGGNPGWATISLEVHLSHFVLFAHPGRRSRIKCSIRTDFSLSAILSAIVSAKAEWASL